MSAVKIRPGTPRLRNIAPSRKPARRKPPWVPTPFTIPTSVVTRLPGPKQLRALELTARAFSSEWPLSIPERPYAIICVVMNLQVKNALTIIFSVAIGLSTGWLVRAAYEKASIWKPLLALLLALGVQIFVTLFVRSKEEEELELIREMRLSKNRQRILEAEQLSARIQLEIKEGRLESAVECMRIRDLL